MKTLLVPLSDDRMDRRADPFIERALLSLADAQAGGPVYDGPAYARYLRDRVHCAVTGSKPSVPKPEPTNSAMGYRYQNNQT